MGDSILFSKSDDIWREKRKHLSAAFYKDKMIQMLDSVANLTIDRVEKWKSEYVGTGREFILNQQVSDHIMDSILFCVFGQTNLDSTL